MSQKPIAPEILPRLGRDLHRRPGDVVHPTAAKTSDMIVRAEVAVEAGLGSGHI